MPTDFRDHPEWKALLATILEFPQDDRPRLVAADWLQEHGEDDYAEFIRLQVELFHKPCDAFMYSCHENGAVMCRCPDYGEWKERRVREHQLLCGGSRGLPCVGTNWCRWAWADDRDDEGRPCPLGGGGGMTVYPTPPSLATAEYPTGTVTVPSTLGPVSQAFRRGFVAEVRCTVATWCGRGCECDGAEPCELCDGTGQVSSPSGLGVMHCPNAYDDGGGYRGRVCVGECSACGSSGWVKGVGPRIVRGQPVEKVVFTDAGPIQWSGHPPFRGESFWYWPFNETVPYDLMTSAEVSAANVGGGRHSLHFDTRDGATAAMSEVAIRWAKGVKG